MQFSWPYFFNLQIHLSYKVTETEAQVASFLRLWSNFSSKTYQNTNERYKTRNTNSFVNVSNNNATFVSMTWNKRNPWLVLYSGIAQLTTHTTNVYKATTYLTIKLSIILPYCWGWLRVKVCLFHHIFEHYNRRYLFFWKNVCPNLQTCF